MLVIEMAILVGISKTKDYKMHIYILSKTPKH